MTVEAWLETCLADADRRGLPALKPLLRAVAADLHLLRAADWTGPGTADSPAADHSRDAEPNDAAADHPVDR